MMRAARFLSLESPSRRFQTDLEANRNAQIRLSTEINNPRAESSFDEPREELVNAQNQEKRNARTQYETLDKRLAVFEPQVVVIDGPVHPLVGVVVPNYNYKQSYKSTNSEYSATDLSEYRTDFT